MIAKKNAVRKLVRSEPRLAPLTRDELRRVAGGESAPAIPFEVCAKRVQARKLEL